MTGAPLLLPGGSSRRDTAHGRTWSAPRRIHRGSRQGTRESRRTCRGPPRLEGVSQQTTKEAREMPRDSRRTSRASRGTWRVSRGTTRDSRGMGRGARRRSERSRKTLLAHLHVPRGTLRRRCVPLQVLRDSLMARRCPLRVEGESPQRPSGSRILPRAPLGILRGALGARKCAVTEAPDPRITSRGDRRVRPDAVLVLGGRRWARRGPLRARRAHVGIPRVSLQVPQVSLLVPRAALPIPRVSLAGSRRAKTWRSVPSVFSSHAERRLTCAVAPLRVSTRRPYPRPPSLLQLQAPKTADLTPGPSPCPGGQSSALQLFSGTERGERCARRLFPLSLAVTSRCQKSRERLRVDGAQTGQGEGVRG
jgi:hypothetical protein